MIDKDTLDYTLLKEWKKLIETILDFSQVAVPSEKWPILRSKILRAANNFMRNLREELGLELESDK